jgi:phosphatidylinositol alpha-1,6-mannosyltransferase
MNKKIIFLVSDLFSKGGIQRYSRTQIEIAREHFNYENVIVQSLWPPKGDAFEGDFSIDSYGQGRSLVSKIKYSAYFLITVIKNKPDFIWINHIRLLPLAFLGKILGSKTGIILNVYGLEIWSGLRYFEKSLINKEINIISDSHYTSRYIQEKYLVKEDRIHVIWDPVDTNRFIPIPGIKTSVASRYQIPYKEDSLILMILGRISITSRHKGYDRLINVMKSIEGVNILLVICGDGNDRTRLERRVRDEGLVERIFFTGLIPEKDLVEVYNMADLFVLVSERGFQKGEGVPLTPLEAASCGIPIIVGDEDGSQEAVQEGINGYIVSPKSPEKLRERIMDLYNHPEKREKMGIQARERIVKEFSYQIFEMRLKKVFESICE